MQKHVTYSKTTEDRLSASIWITPVEIINYLDHLRRLIVLSDAGKMEQLSRLIIWNYLVLHNAFFLSGISEQN